MIHNGQPQSQFQSGLRTNSVFVLVGLAPKVNRAAKSEGSKGPENLVICENSVLVPQQRSKPNGTAGSAKSRNGGFCVDDRRQFKN
jgi:hypothetical protein